jgi:hypothetical protein
MTHPTAKLAPKRYGPFTIKKKVSDVVFQLELPHQWKIHDVFHAFLLTPYVETELHGPNYPEPPPEIVEGDPKFEIEQIVGSRQVGKKKTLQYKIRWKGYSQAHDSWEPAVQVHAPELIRKFQKTKSSQRNQTTINYQSASGIPPRLKALTPPQAYSSLTEAESSELKGETDKGSASGKRTRVSPTIQMENKEWSSSSNNDKREGRNPENIIIPPPLFHINSCTMDNNCDNMPLPLSIEEICNMNLSEIDTTKVYDELVRVLGEKQNSEQRGTTNDTNENAVVGPSTQPPPRTMVEDHETKEEVPNVPISPTHTEDLHLGYLYRENVNNNNDLPMDNYP